LGIERDTLFQSQGNYPLPFQFNEQVAAVFDDMLVRSIPGYETSLYFCMRLAEHMGQSSSNLRLYDLGCSTAKLFRLFLRHNIKGQWIGLDCSQAMIEQAKRFDLPSSVFLECADIVHYTYQPADMFALNYVLQFLPLSSRVSLLKSIQGALKPGGCVFISEKLRIEDEPLNLWITQEYDLFKERNGYARIEIERKKEALQNVLVSTTETELKQMLLEEAGFKTMHCIQRHLHFATYVVS
jgi:tRNA (cmo5U34)-methyltransferase